MRQYTKIEYFTFLTNLARSMEYSRVIPDELMVEWKNKKYPEQGTLAFLRAGGTKRARILKELEGEIVLRKLLGKSCPQ